MGPPLCSIPGLNLHPIKLTTYFHQVTEYFLSGAVFVFIKGFISEGKSLI